ncbi:MAG: hypothetical protein KGO05_12470 [Chloroflexota bacterium]|nr:hypothetical protein [Chloroflexota bacterium]
MGILKLAGRVVALVIGLIGSVVSILITIITVVAFHTSQLFDTSGVLDPNRSHGFIGFLAFLVGVIGSLLVVFAPTTGAVLLLIGGLAMLYVAGVWGIIPLVILGIAALIAFADRSRARA